MLWCYIEAFHWSRLVRNRNIWLRLGLHKAGVKHLLLHLKSSLVLFQLTLSRLKLLFEISVLIPGFLDLVLHASTFLFSFAAAEARALSILEEPVLFRRQELAHVN